jgi:hypothetical protein
MELVCRFESHRSHVGESREPHGERQPLWFMTMIQSRVLMKVLTDGNTRDMKVLDRFEPP